MGGETGCFEIPPEASALPMLCPRKCASSLSTGTLKMALPGKMPEALILWLQIDSGSGFQPVLRIVDERAKALSYFPGVCRQFEGAKNAPCLFLSVFICFHQILRLRPQCTGGGPGFHHRCGQCIRPQCPGRKRCSRSGKRPEQPATISRRPRRTAAG